MYTENIIRDIKELIHDTKRNWSNVHKSKTDAFRDDDLEEALWGIDQACDGFSYIEDQLTLLIEKIEMEALGAQARGRVSSEAAKVQSKTKTLSELFDEEESKK